MKKFLYFTIYISSLICGKIYANKALGKAQRAIFFSLLRDRARRAADAYTPGRIRSRGGRRVLERADRRSVGKSMTFTTCSLCTSLAKERRKLYAEAVLIDGNGLVVAPIPACVALRARRHAKRTPFRLSGRSVAPVDDEKPDALCVMFDRREPTFRHKHSRAYKATCKPRRRMSRADAGFEGRARRARHRRRELSG